jgi:RNA-directed DNA polymerase
LEAVRDRTCALPYGRDGSLREAAIHGCLDHMAHTGRVDLWRWRSDARALLRLMHQGLQAGIVATAGPGVQPETGTPQGGTVSPVRAPVYLHEALARWLEPVGQPPGQGEARWCRSADDGVWACRLQEDAARFCRGLPQRLGTCHLQVAPEQTHLRRFRRLHPSTQRRCTLLGCACCWRPDRHGVPRVRRRTARQTLPAAGQRLTAGMKPHRPLPGRECFPRLHARLRGHDNS